MHLFLGFFFFVQAEDGIRDYKVTGVQTCALPIYYLRLLIPEVLRDALWLVTKYAHMATYGHGRNHPGESQRDRATAALGHLPDYLAGNCGVASPRPPDRRRDLCTGRNRSCTSRLMRCQGRRNNFASEV